MRRNRLSTSVTSSVLWVFGICAALCSSWLPSLAHADDRSSNVSAQRYTAAAPALPVSPLSLPFPPVGQSYRIPTGSLLPLPSALTALTRCTGKIVEIPFDDLGGAIELPIHEEVGTTIYLPRKQIADIAYIPNKHIEVVRTTQQLVIIPRAGAPEGVRTSLKLTGYNHQQLSIYTVVVGNPNISPDTVRLVPRSELEAREALVHAKVETQVRQEIVKREQENRRKQAQEAAQAPFRLAEQLLGTNQLRVSTMQNLTTVADDDRVRSAQVVIKEIINHTHGERSVRHVRFLVSNLSNDALGLEQMRFGTPHGKETFDAEVVLFSQPGAGYVEFPIRIPAGQTVTGIARIPDNANLPNEGLTIAIDGPSILQSLVAEASHLASIDTFEQELERIRQRERETKERERLQQEREARGQQTIISAVAHGGAYFIGDGVDGTSDSNASATWTVGGKVTKGLAEPIAFEAELVGGRIGDGKFRDVEWNGRAGDIERSASFGRVGIGVALRLGDIAIPYAYAGVGVQLTGYTSTFVTGDATANGPGDGFEVAGFVTGGGGFDYRVGGEDLLIGVRASYMGLQGGERSISAGAHLGVGL